MVKKDIKMNYRLKIIQGLINTHGYMSYLEVGVQYGETFNDIVVRKKIGVDPKPQTTISHTMTSDEFFAENKNTFDIIFIDGLHTHQQSLKDIQNSLKILNKGGSIVVHDCLPKTKEEQIVPRQQKYWTGDVWKSVVILQQDPKLEIKIYDVESGIGVIAKGKNKKPLTDIPKELTWEYFNENKDKIFEIEKIQTKKAVYTCLMGDYDILKDPLVVSDEWDYICYTDQDTESDIWKIRKIAGDVIKQREVKILGFAWLHGEGYEKTIYIDSNFEIIAEPPEFNFAEFVLVTHYERRCAYREIEACINLKKDDLKKLKRVKDMLIINRYPKANGLYACGYMYRGYSEKLYDVMKQWFEMIKKYTHRDQITLPYVLWVNHYTPHEVSLDDRNMFLKIYKHKK
jgi:SAM-dependent methyltransferase